MTQGEAENRVWPDACVHIRKGQLSECERLELTLTLTTIGATDDDYRYTKGPDTVRLCAFCAGKLLGVFVKECIRDDAR